MLIVYNSYVFMLMVSGFLLIPGGLWITMQSGGIGKSDWFRTKPYWRTLRNISKKYFFFIYTPAILCLYLLLFRERVNFFAVLYYIFCLTIIAVVGQRLITKRKIIYLDENTIPKKYKQTIYPLYSYVLLYPIIFSITSTILEK